MSPRKLPKLVPLSPYPAGDETEEEERGWSSLPPRRARVPRGERSMWPATSAPVPIAFDDPLSRLPSAEGSLILILGGTAVLALSLALSLLSPRSAFQRRPDPTPNVGPRPKRSPSSAVSPPPEQVPKDTRLDRQTLVLKVAARAGLGTPQILTATPYGHELVLVPCLRCQANATAGTACGWKQEALQRALTQFAPGGQVRYLTCFPGEPALAMFEIQTGGPRP